MTEEQIPEEEATEALDVPDVAPGVEPAAVDAVHDHVAERKSERPDELRAGLERRPDPFV